MRTAAAARSTAIMGYCSFCTADPSLRTRQRSCEKQDKARAIEELWRKFFADPSQWQDNRFLKGNHRFPDFVHSTTKEILWIDGSLNPSWVETKLGSLKPCTAASLQDSAVECGKLSGNNGRMTEVDSSFGSLGRFKQLCKEGRVHEAIQIIKLMDQQGIRVSTTTLYCLVQGCINKKDLIAGRKIYSLITKSRFDLNTFLGNHLIRMFALCGSLVEATKVFYKLPEPNVFAWTAMILAHAKHRQGPEAIKLYLQMKQSCVMPGEHIFVAVLKVCSSLEALDEGKLVHAQIIISCFILNSIVGNTLISMYAKCGSLCDACRVFDKMPKASVVTWNAMIGGYVDYKHGREALQLFYKMQQDAGIKPDTVTYVSILGACCLLSLDQGKNIHAHMLESEFEMHVNVVNALIDMYAKCGSLQDTIRMFEKVKRRDLVTWSAMIGAYVEHGHCKEALQVFKHLQREALDLDNVAFVSILKACCGLGALDTGKLIHAHLIATGSEADAFVRSTLIDMYAKCWSLEDACKISGNLRKENVVSWSTIIAGHAQHGCGKEALQLFQRMQREGINSNTVVFLSILKACTSIGALDEGRLIYCHMIKTGCELEASLVSALIGMYAKCGCLQDACAIFDRLPKQSLVTWTIIIASYAECNNYVLALHLFKSMVLEGVKPDYVTFACLLSACSHMGLVDEGCHSFRSMRDKHDVLPMHEHYNCMIDLLGRAGRLSEAEDILQTIPFQPDIVGWMCLLSHCRTHGDLKLGRRCFDTVMTIDNRHASAYVLMSSIYGDAGMWEDADRIQEQRSCAHAWKKAGRACVEADNEVHDFTVGDKDNSYSNNIYSKLRILSSKIKDRGYVPDLDLFLQPIVDEDKDEASCASQDSQTKCWFIEHQGMEGVGSAVRASQLAA